MKAKLGSITFRGDKRKSFLGMRLRKGFQISEEPGENRDGIEFQKSFRGCAVQWFPNLAARCSYWGKALEILIVFTDKETVCQM